MTPRGLPTRRDEGRSISTVAKTPPKSKTLKECVLFREFTDEEMSQVMPFIVEKTLPKGAPLYVEHMLGETMYIVKSGQVKISKNLPQIGEKTLLAMGPGDFFGELALFDTSQRLTNAVCATETEIYLLPADAFRKLMITEPATALKFLTVMTKIFSQRLRKNESLFADFFTWQLTQR